MTNERIQTSVQKKLIDKKRSFYHKYSMLILGRKGFFHFLKFELITFLFSWIPGAIGLLSRRLFYPCLFQKVGKSVIFGKGITLRHPHKIRIGDYSVIDDHVVLDAKGENNEGIHLGRNVYIGRNTILSCKEGNIRLDDYCNISANCSLLSETEITLGKYCFLAGHCYLVAGGNHSFEDISIPIMFQPSLSKGGIHIEEDVWLGAGVIVLDGVSIGKGCVVAAGSVVNRSLKAYYIAAGVPIIKIGARKT